MGSTREVALTPPNASPVAAAAGATEQQIKAEAYALGFDLCGITDLTVAERAASAYERWVDGGHAGEMAYMVRNADRRRDPRLVHPGARSAVVVGMSYGGREPSGPVARYARGDDYHDVMRDRLITLHRWIEQQRGEPIAGRAYVDTAPILERELARRAGLGWLGKNTNLINPTLGSFFFIGSLFLDLELTPDAPFEADRCGTCTRCLDACPTDAFVEPRVLDSRRCISYLTIELRGPIPDELREGVGEHVYGCDVCQEVCPYSYKFAKPLAEPAFVSRSAVSGRDARTLSRELLAMSPEEFSAAFSRSPMKRAKLRGLKRNAAVALGNVGTAEDVPTLVAALSHPEPLLREHAAWALGRRASAEALAALRDRLPNESDERVRDALRLALSGPVG